MRPCPVLLRASLDGERLERYDELMHRALLMTHAQITGLPHDADPATLASFKDAVIDMRDQIVAADPDLGPVVLRNLAEVLLWGVQFVDSTEREQSGQGCPVAEGFEP